MCRKNAFVNALPRILMLLGLLPALTLTPVLGQPASAAVPSPEQDKKISQAMASAGLSWTTEIFDKTGHTSRSGGIKAKRWVSGGPDNSYTFVIDAYDTTAYANEE